MVDLRKILIIFVVAVLFSVFVTTSIDALYPTPTYEHFCTAFGPRPHSLEIEPPEKCPDSVAPKTTKECETQKGYIDYKTFDDQGCPKEAFCNMCNTAFEDARERHDLIYFVLSAVAGLIAISLGVLLPSGKNPLNEWIGTGFMLGGLFILFFGTVRGFGGLHRFLRPIVILAELLIIIWLSYKKLGKEK